MTPCDKPSIIDVVSRYVTLRRCGREYSGFCPFHLEKSASIYANEDLQKSASFYVNEEKGSFYCHGCHEGGDVIRFIEKVEDVDFKGALSHLGLADQPPLTRAKIKKREAVGRASKNLRAWALALSERIGTRMRESGDRAYMAKKILRELPGANKGLLQDEIKRATREWHILSTLEEDVLDPKQTATLWKDREDIEWLVGGEA